MKIQYVVAIVIALAGAGPAAAQTPSPAAATQAPRYAVDATAIADLAADPAAKALVAKHLPSLFAHPSYEMIKTMTLRAIAPYSGGSINDETLVALQKDLDALS